MSTVVVERSFAEPVLLEDIQAIEDRGAWCLEAHGVRFLRTYFSRDRRRMICLYEAGDAESVRIAQQQAGVPFDVAWTAHTLRHEAPEPDGDTVVVERSLSTPLDEPTIRQAVAEGGWCFQQHGCRIVWSLLSPDGLRCLCVFAAPDAEAVRQVQRSIEMPYDSVWPATLHVPPQPAP